MRAAALEAAILDAHARGDVAALAAFYAEAAGTATDARAGFFLTQAYIFALEAGLSEAEALHARLAAMGRD